MFQSFCENFSCCKCFVSAFQDSTYANLTIAVYSQSGILFPGCTIARTSNILLALNDILCIPNIGSILKYLMTLCWMWEVKHLMCWVVNTRSEKKSRSTHELTGPPARYANMSHVHELITLIDCISRALGRLVDAVPWPKSTLNIYERKTLWYTTHSSCVTTRKRSSTACSFASAHRRLWICLSRIRASCWYGLVWNALRKSPLLVKHSDCWIQ